MKTLHNTHLRNNVHTTCSTKSFMGLLFPYAPIYIIYIISGNYTAPYNILYTMPAKRLLILKCRGDRRAYYYSFSQKMFN